MRLKICFPIEAANKVVRVIRLANYLTVCFGFYVQDLLGVIYLNDMVHGKRFTSGFDFGNKMICLIKF